MDQGDEYGDADEDPKTTPCIISYCHRHCRVDKERQKGFGYVAGTRHGEDGNDGVIVSGPWIKTKDQKSQTSAEAEEENGKSEQRELESTRTSDSTCLILRRWFVATEARTSQKATLERKRISTTVIQQQTKNKKAISSQRLR